MKYIIAKEINLILLIKSTKLKPCCVHYLDYCENPFYNRLINTYFLKRKIIFKHIKMGREISINQYQIFSEAGRIATKKIYKLRKNLFRKSNNILFNLITDMSLKSKWDAYQKDETIKLYYESKLYLSKNKGDIYLIKNKNYKNYIKEKIENFFCFSIIKYSIILLDKVLRIIPNPGINKKKLKVDNLILSPDTFPKSKKEFYYRNQFVLSENLSNKDSFINLDIYTYDLFFENKKIYVDNGSFISLVNKICKKFLTQKKFSLEDYNIDLKNLILFFRLLYKIWINTENLNPAKFIFDSNDNLCQAFLYVAKLKNKSAYIYQFSLLAYMNPWLHSPYAGLMYFTNIHRDLYLEESKSIEGAELEVIKIKYPLQAYVDINKIDKFRTELVKRFKMVILYFDENFADDNLHSHYGYFLEDYISDLKHLLKFSNKFPNLGILFKPQFYNRRIKNFFEFDEELENLYDPKRHLEFVKNSKFNYRNIFIPSEISQMADLSISHSYGGTAAYESRLSGNRSVFINSSVSVYEKIMPDNVCFNSLEDITKKLESLDCDREKLSNSNLGEFNTKGL